MEELNFILKSYEISSTKFRNKISLNYPLKIDKPYTSWMDGIWKPYNA
jgi:hypothetical protein